MAALKIKSILKEARIYMPCFVQISTLVVFFFCECIFSVKCGECFAIQFGKNVYKG